MEEHQEDRLFRLIGDLCLLSANIRLKKDTSVVKVNDLNHTDIQNSLNVLEILIENGKRDGTINSIIKGLNEFTFEDSISESNSSNDLIQFDQ